MSLESEKLDREVRILEQRKNVLNETVDKLSKESLSYLESIPKSKEWAQEQTKLAEEVRIKTVGVVATLNERSQDLKNLNFAIQRAHDELDILRKENDEELIRLTQLKKELDIKNNDLKKREVLLQNASGILETKQSINSDNSKSIAEAAAKLLNDKEAYEKKCADLQNSLDSIFKREEELGKRTQIFEENKVTFFNQQEELTFKLTHAKDLVSKNSEIQADLLDKSKRLDIELAKTVSRQNSLDVNIKDLENRKKELDIRELQIKKLAYDSDLKKQHDDLVAGTPK